MESATIAEADNTVHDPTRPTKLVLGDHDFTSLTDKVCRIVEKPKPPRAWYIAFGASTALTALFLTAFDRPYSQ